MNELQTVVTLALRKNVELNDFINAYNTAFNENAELIDEREIKAASILQHYNWYCVIDNEKNYLAEYNRQIVANQKSIEDLKAMSWRCKQKQMY